MRKQQKQILSVFFLLFYFISNLACASISLRDNIQVAVNQLGELSGYMTYLTNKIQAQLAATPASNLNAINSNDIFTNGATFSTIDIVNGKIYIYLNDKIGLGAIDNRTIECIPNVISTRQDGLYDTILSWSCKTDIKHIYANGRKYDVLTYLPYPLSVAEHDATIN